MSTQPILLAHHPWAFEGVVRLTRIGVIFVIFTVLIGFAAINTGNNSLYIGLTFMLGCLILSGLASKGGLKHLEVDIAVIDQPWAGRPVHGLVKIHNRSPVWNVRDIVITSEDVSGAVLVAVAPKRGEIELEIPFLFRRRGIVELKTLDFYTRYPFGFFLKKRRIPIHGEVVVYPRLLDAWDSDEQFHMVMGEHSVANRPGLGSEIHSFREYMPGDSLRHVYWKKSANLGRWIIKQTDADAARVVHVVVDPFKPRGVSDERFEEFVSEATTFVHQAMQRGLDVVLTLPRHTIRAQERQGSAGMFRALALLEPAYEPFSVVLDRDTIVFSLRSHETAATA